MIHHQLKHRENKRVHDASLQMKTVTLMFVFYSSFNTELTYHSICSTVQVFSNSVGQTAEKGKYFKVEAVKYSLVFRG